MTQQEIKDKIADLEKKSKNQSLPASAVAKLDKMVDDLKGQLEKEPKAEPKAEAKKKAEPKAKAKQKAKSKSKAKKSPPKRTKAEKTEKDCDELIEREESAHSAGYDVDELLKTAKERKAKAKERAKAKKNEPKKTPATKNKEVIEKATDKVVTNVEKRVEKDDVSVSEIEKLIEEYKDAIKNWKNF